MAEYSAVVEEIVFRNEENGYSVLSVRPEDGRPFTAVGIVPFVEEGDNVRLTGEWAEHRDYGKQLKVTAFTIIEPEGRDAIKKFLASGVIRGVGPDTANRIVKQFGADTMNVLDTHPERLTEVPGIGSRKAEMILVSYLEKRESRTALMYFLNLGMTPSMAHKLWTAYGHDAMLITRSDPYRLADDIKGIGFAIADSIALKQGYAKNDDRRIRSGIKFVLNESVNGEGNTYLPMDTLMERASSILAVAPEEIDVCMRTMLLKRDIISEEDGEGTQCVFLRSVYEAECDVARILTVLSSKKALLTAADTGNVDMDGILLSPKQTEALEAAVTHPVTVITGGPGTGKTTLIKGILSVFSCKKTVALCAPTGRAAKRMSEATGREAMTIHRLLEYQEGGFQKNEDEPLRVDAVIVDEMSMVDIFLMRALLKALRPGTMLIMTGDVDQLPSVGAGNVLRDIIVSGAVEVVRLTEVYRQSEMSAIVMNAHRINRGEMPVTNAKGSDFFIEHVQDASAALKSVRELITRRLPGYMPLDPLKDIQVMAPMKKGDVGVYALNTMLQEVLNPLAGRKQFVRGDSCFRVGDKVIQTRNDYNMKWRRGFEDGEGVFNGDIGYITDLNFTDNTFTVTFDDDRVAVYDKDSIENIELAYCMSIHKSQGSEFPCVVLPLLAGPPMLLSRNLLYTAVTRAKKLVVIVGRDSCVMQMVNNKRESTRYSSLCRRLSEAKEKL